MLLDTCVPTESRQEILYILFLWCEWNYSYTCTRTRVLWNLVMYWKEQNIGNVSILHKELPQIAVLFSGSWKHRVTVSTDFLKYTWY